MRKSKRLSRAELDQFVQEIEKYPLLTKEEESELAQKVREKGDNRAKEKLFLSNLRMVLHLCKGFQNYGLTMSELIDAGTRGLMHAIEKFDERKGYRLSTYATRWIKKEIYKAIQSVSEIVPKSRLSKRIKSFISGFVQEKGRKPTVQEIATALKTTNDQVSQALTELVSPISLDETLIYENYAEPVIETISIDQMDERKLVQPPPDELLRQKQESERIQRALKRLSPREREILERNFGLGDNDEQSLEQISRLMNISKERVRQIRENALKKLKFILPRIK